MTAHRILFVSHSSTVSGAEAVLIELVKSFAGASAFVFDDGPLPQRLASQGLKVIVSRWGKGISRVKREGSLLSALPLAGRFLAITLEIARAARRHEVIYANSQKAFVLSAIAACIARRPLIWHLHDIPSREHFGRAQLKLQITLANLFADRVIVPSRAVKDGFVASGGHASLVRIVPNGIAPPPEKPRSRAALTELGIPPGQTVGVFSRLAAWKGQHVLIEALNDLPGVQAIIVGSALFGEDAYAEELAALVERLGLSRRVHFLGQRSDVVDLMRAVDVVVHPSISAEPFGLTLIEGALAGTPVVGAAAGAVPEILDGGRAGSLVAPGDAPALARAIREILSLPQEAAKRSVYARARAEQFYTAERMSADVGEVVAELFAKGGR